MVRGLLNSAYTLMPAHGCTEDHRDCNVSRRNLLRGAGLTGAAACVAMTGLGLALPGDAFAVALGKDERDGLSPQQVLDRLMEGNERFRNNRPLRHDYLAQKAATGESQHPAAIILSCIDSRAPAEILMDTGIGDVFNTRLAGNVINPDVLGSMEFACAVAGSKLVLVMGHTSCGAIKGAIAGAQLGNLTGLVERMKPAVEATAHEGRRDEKNLAFVDDVARTHVRMTVQSIRQQSSVLAGLERSGAIALQGAMYHLRGGRIELLDA